LELFSQLVKNIPIVQLLILLINFHFSLVNAHLLNIASGNNTHLVACPSNMSHLLQKAGGGGVRRTLKLAFRDRLNKLMTENPNSLVATGTSNLPIICYSSIPQLSVP